MNAWHGTDDAPRVPSRVSPTQPVDLTIGTWPIAPGQSVWVTWRAGTLAGAGSHGSVAAQWQRNHGANSYWGARLGPFADGDRVTYAVHASDARETVEGGSFAVTVKPSLYIAWLWHHHQPLYRDPDASRPQGSYRQPWVRLHALRDYYSMAAIAAGHGVHLTFNLTPVLLRQIDDYVLRGATDTALELTHRSAADLSEAESEDLLSTFFEADLHHQIDVHPRYRELFDQRTSGQRFTVGDLQDLQMWFSLAWFAEEFRTGPVSLVTGEAVRVHQFVQQQRGFSRADVVDLIEEQYKILRAVVPLHRQLQEEGRIEVSTTPAFHPILPLIINSDEASLDRAGAMLPSAYVHPEDAAAHIALAADDYRRRFGREPLGMWPAEGAVSPAAVALLASHRVQWIASDRGVLAKSGLWGYRVDQPDVLCQPYCTVDAAAGPVMFFRDTALSDAIGFRYNHFADSTAAVEDFMRALESDCLNRLTGDDDRVLTIALDGENAWSDYPDDGRPFLHALYDRLATDPRLKTVTFAEYIGGNPSRGIAPHPAASLARVDLLAAGSWVDEPGSAPGVDLGTWIGEPEENAAWRMLSAARAVLNERGGAGAGTPAAEALLAAEGSDWFWWLGADHESRNDADFDDLFRGHLRAVYRAAGATPPASLDEPIIRRPVVWTFTRPIATIRRSDQISIRTNCPGRLEFQVDDAAVQDLTVSVVGSVLSGPRRFQATLGPFAPAAARLAFRFHCEHPGCSHDATCRVGGRHVIALT